MPEIEFRSPVTFLVGENGTSKSTLLEAIAPAVGAVTIGSGSKVAAGIASGPGAPIVLAPIDAVDVVAVRCHPTAALDQSREKQLAVRRVRVHCQWLPVTA